MKGQEYDWLLLLKTSTGQASIFGYRREKKCKAVYFNGEARRLSRNEILAMKMKIPSRRKKKIIFVLFQFYFEKVPKDW
jgi:hypothetical protein